jgi:hypothetical protein
VKTTGWIADAGLLKAGRALGSAVMTKLALLGPASTLLEPGATARLRLHSWMSVDYFLDVAAIARGRRDHLDTLLLSVFVHANVDEIERRAALQVAHAGAHEDRAYRQCRERHEYMRPLRLSRDRVHSRTLAHAGHQNCLIVPDHMLKVTLAALIAA